MDKVISISCVDTLFGQRVIIGSCFTMDEAFKIVQHERACKPKSTFDYEFHDAQLGYYVLSAPVTLCVLPRRLA